jgi:hypothetical protein
VGEPYRRIGVSAYRRIFHAKTLTENGAFKSAPNGSKRRIARAPYADTPLADTPSRSVLVCFNETVPHSQDPPGMTRDILFVGHYNDRVTIGVKILQ